MKTRIGKYLLLVVLGLAIIAFLQMPLTGTKNPKDYVTRPFCFAG